MLEINQACAVNTGCFAGDAAGFPVTITSPGSYRLTSDLTLPTDDEAITDLAGTSNVTLDLNGFVLTGIGLGAKNGIQLFTGNNWEIRNGTLRLFGGNAVQDSSSIGRGHRMIGLRLESNGVGGIQLGNSRNNIVRDCYAVLNGGTGLRVGDSGKVIGSTSEGNLGGGISTGMDSIVADNVVVSNNGRGISAGSGSKVSGNVATNNTSEGIYMFTDGVALDNTIRDNANVGLRFSDTTGGYARNVINGNSSSVLNGTQIGTNLCDGNTTCP